MKTPVGTIPNNDSGFTSKFRIHQGWWRKYVLHEKQGMYFNKKEDKWHKVCNRINNGEQLPFRKNFLSKDIANAVRESLLEQHESGKGIMEIERLYNNLLSSQPLAFNFFGYLKYNTDIALELLKTYNANLTEVIDVVFEYAPDASSDNSAFDFGFIVKEGDKKGFIGFECKYTDTFSYKRSGSSSFYGDKEDKNHDRYNKLYSENRDRFPDEYHTYVRSKQYNQLFRNELLGVQILGVPEYNFIKTGLFCHHDDKNTIEAGYEFQKKIGNGVDDFIVMPYSDYFDRMLKLNLSWDMRELVMMIWARYCGLQLSERMRIKKKN